MWSFLGHHKTHEKHNGCSLKLGKRSPNDAGGAARAPPFSCPIPSSPSPNSIQRAPPTTPFPSHPSQANLPAQTDDADDAGPRGQHHQHHYKPVSQIWGLPVPPPTSKKQCWGPEGPRRLVFKTVRAHDAHFGGFTGLLKCLKNPSVPLGFASKSHVSFGVVLEGGLGGPLGEAEVQ